MKPNDSSGTRKGSRKLDREESERRLIAAFDRVWSRDGIQGLGVNAVLKEAGMGKALLYRYFGDFVGLAKAWAQGESFLPKPPAATPPAARRHPAVATDIDKARGEARGEATARHVGSAIAYARALRERPKTRELLIMELLRSSPITEALDSMRIQFGREMREFVMASGAGDGEDAYALSFFVTAAMTYLALRADTVPDYYGMRLDRDADWERIERMLEMIASRVLSASAPGASRPRQPP